MIRAAPRWLVLLAALGPALAWAAPADGQRRPTRSTRTSASPLEDASTARRAGEPAGRVAVALVRTHRLRSSQVAETLLRAGYEAPEVGRALVQELDASPREAAVDLERAGVRDGPLLYTAMVAMHRSSTDAMRTLRAIKGSRTAIAILERAGAYEAATAEETAEAMSDGGFSLQEIFDVLAGAPYDLSADDILALFLELGLADADDATVYEWLREKGVSAAEAVAAATDAGLSAEDAAVVLGAAGYAWDVISDGLHSVGHAVGDAAKAVGRAIRRAGGSVLDAVEWAWSTGALTAEEIMETLTAYGDGVVEVAEAMLESQVPAEDVAEAAIAAAASIEQVVQLLQDMGFSPDEVAAILNEIGVAHTRIIEVLISVMNMRYDAVMRIISALPG